MPANALTPMGVRVRMFTGIVMRQWWRHYNAVIMSAMASRITSISNIYSTVCSGADQRKHQSSASLAFVLGIHWWPVNSPYKWPVTRKMFHLITSSWKVLEPMGGQCQDIYGHSDTVMRQWGRTADYCPCSQTVVVNLNLRPDQPWVAHYKSPLLLLSNKKYLKQWNRWYN